MSTPNLKLLMNALRLGQPQDPQAAFFVLAEAIALQDETISELKRKLAVAQSAVALLQTKVARLERDETDDITDRARVLPPETQSRDRPSSERPAPQFGPRPGAAIPQPPQSPSTPGPSTLGPSTQSPLGGGAPRPNGGPMRASAHPPMTASTARSRSARPEPQPAQEVQISARFDPRSPGSASRSRPPQTASALPPDAPSAEAGSPPSRGPSVLSAPSIIAARESERGSRPPTPSDDSMDFPTMAMSKRDIAAIAPGNAPFRIASPGATVPSPQGSIPGAPWARGQRMVAPEITDDFTVDALEPVGAASRSGEDDAETFEDDGQELTAVARALGISPDDPRLAALRSGR